MNLKSLIILQIISSVFFYSCSNSSAGVNPKLPAKVCSTDDVDSTSEPKSPCDPALWKYVYDAPRLQVLDKCKTVSGVIEETNADEDGDQQLPRLLQKYLWNR